MRDPDSGWPDAGSSVTTVSTVPARLIVKLKGMPVQRLASSGPDRAGAAVDASASAVEPGFTTLLSKYSVRAASPLLANEAGVLRETGRSADQPGEAVRRRFPNRSRRAPAGAVVPDLSSTYVFDLGARTAAEVAETVRSLNADPGVLYAEEDKVVRVQYVPNDPYYLSSGYWGQVFDDLYGLKRIGAAQAWDTTRGEGIVVAVIDTGIDYNHPDIRANIWTNPRETPGNGIDDDRNGFVDDVRGWDFVGSNAAAPVPDNDPADVNGHGSHVAGTIAAEGDNNLGVVGVAWHAKVMAVRALDDGGLGYDSTLAEAIVYAADSGADVINASWGRSGTSQVLADAIGYAHSLGVVFVAAAGNDSMDAGEFVPANVATAIAVSALGPVDEVASFSNRGVKVELAAPGVDIFSLQSGSGGYVTKSGTSMAAPHVSGAAALILAKHPAYTQEQVRQALRFSATDLGPLGRDSSFGYGLVNPAGALTITTPLGVQILAPVREGEAVSAVTVLTGTAAGEGFDRYVLDFGCGENPEQWTVLRQSPVSVVNGTLGTFDPTVLPDGLYSVRLRAYDGAGRSFADVLRVRVGYLELTWPAAPRYPSQAVMVKAGLAHSLTGSARGPSFQRYRLEWARGAEAVSGWTTDGLTAVGDGRTQVSNSTIGTWTPPSEAGFYTLRLTVENAGFVSVATTTLYVEPALFSNAWPRGVGSYTYDHSALPLGQPDGSTRFLLCGAVSAKGSVCRSIALDGSMNTVPLDHGTEKQPSVGNLDGQPGDEAVVPDALALKIFSGDLTLIRSITAAVPRVFWVDQSVLADLDDDGVPEIIAPARDTQSPTGISYRLSGALHVYRADGSLFAPKYPLPIVSPLDPSGDFTRVHVVAVDLDGNGRKEIVMAIEAANLSGYTVQAYNADGSPYAGFPAVSFDGLGSYEGPRPQISSLAAADLDRDGTSELVAVETTEGGVVWVRVLNSTGVVRPGWPLVVSGGYVAIKVAIGDLDRDQRHEIVVVAPHEVQILRDDGTQWGPRWAPQGTGLGQPVLADLDGDGYPEILASHLRSVWLNGGGEYSSVSLVAYRRDGVELGRWPLPGIGGAQASLGLPLVGDFDSDGNADIMATYPLIDGGGFSGWIKDGALTVFSTGTPFSAVGSPWRCGGCDPQNSRTLNQIEAAPTIGAQPADQRVVVGTSASFTVVVGGYPVPACRWQASTDDGGSWSDLANNRVFSGAGAATLWIDRVTPSMTGCRYRCVATNGVGAGATSEAATLVVDSSAVPVIAATLPRTLRVVAGQAGSVEVTATGASSYQWYRGGQAVAGATAPKLAFASTSPAESGIYDVLVAGAGGEILSAPVVVGVVPAAGQRTAGAVVTRSEWQDIHHPNGAVYDQFLLTGAAGTFTADPGQIARMSYLDEDNSIVQVEMSGAGAITVNLANATGPMAPALYNQSGIVYMKGRATIILAGADVTTHFTIYSVGTATNPGVTRADATYAGWANVAAAGIISTDGKLGGIHQGNVAYQAAVGPTGLYAPEVTTVGGVAVIHGIAASDWAVPYLFFGAGGTVAVKIAGTDLAQPSGDSVTVGGLAQVQMGAGQDSCGRAAGALPVQGRLTDHAGTDVTTGLVRGP